LILIVNSKNYFALHDSINFFYTA